MKTEYKIAIIIAIVAIVVVLGILYKFELDSHTTPVIPPTLYTFTSFKECNSTCVELGYEIGNPDWPDSQEWEGYTDFELGPYTDGSNHCPTEGRCNCYCYKKKWI